MTAVPVDVRVIDKDGKPIVDLRREDFTVLEDGVPQAIAHFAEATLVAKAPRAGLRARPETPAFTTASATTPQDYRVFLIVLGARGLGDTRRHPETLDALLDFVRHKLLPQDQVAVLAGNRASDFTSDHEKVAWLLEASRGIGGAELPGRTSSPAVPDRSATTRRPPPRRPQSTPNSASRTTSRREAESRSTNSRVSSTASATCGSWKARSTWSYVTDRGFDLPDFDGFNGIWNFREIENWAHMKQLTRAANDARVALNTIVTGEPVIALRIPRDMPAPSIQREMPAVSNPEAEQRAACRCRRWPADESRRGHDWSLRPSPVRRGSLGACHRWLGLPASSWTTT